MRFRELRVSIKSIDFCKVREDVDNYFEAVIVKDKVEELCRTLERFLGPPVWPAKNKLSHQIKAAIKKFGGIAGGQTLYFSHQDNNILLAMLWPWRDSVHITVKIAQQGR